MCYFLRHCGSLLTHSTGTCRNGNKCPFPHVYNNSNNSTNTRQGSGGAFDGKAYLKEEIAKFANPNNLDSREKELRDSLQSHGEIEMTPLTSSFGFQWPATVSLITGRDYSPEESRWDFYQAQATNSIPQYEQMMRARQADTEWCISELLRDSRKASRYSQLVAEKAFNDPTAIAKPFLDRPLNLTGQPQQQQQQSTAFGNSSFGSQQQSSSPFGAMGLGGSTQLNANPFGAQTAALSTKNTSPFGALAASQSAPAFGSTSIGSSNDNKTPAFGSNPFGSTQQPTTTSPFGAKTGGSAFGRSSFGQSSLSQQTTTTSTSAFGTSSLGGTSNPAFGSSSFGATAKPTTSSAFGSSGFGQASAAVPTLGASTSSPFGALTGGQTGNTSPFGQSGKTQTTSVFGSGNSAGASPFGQSGSLAGGGPSPLGQSGQPATSAFGQMAPATSSLSAFGQAQPTSSSAFGQAQMTSSSPFGQSGFGQTTTSTNASPFGQKTTANNAFGSGGFGLGAKPSGTSLTPIKQSAKEPERIKEDELSDFVKEQFASQQFTLGQIPEIEPPLVYC